MKNLLLLFILPFTAFSQTDTISNVLPYQGDRVIYESTVDTEGIKKDVLYFAAKKWIIDNFQDGKAVIQIDNQQTGQIVGSGYVLAELIYNKGIFEPMRLKFNFQIDCRDGKYRIRYYNLYQADTNESPIETVDKVTQPAYKNGYNERWPPMRKAINAKFIGLLNSFNVGIEKSKVDSF